MQSIREKFIMFFLSFFLVATPSLAMVAWYDTPAAYADVGSFVSSGLSGSYSVSTSQSPGTYHTQGENIYSLGYSELRFNTAGQNLQLFSITPPSFSIGCSGIDATFGAFAMLGSHLMSMLQSLIQSGQVVVFAFNMVLGVLCKQCEHIMNQIEAIANKLNGLNFNSCQAAEAAGNIAGAEIGSMSAIQQASGATNAFADTINSDLGSVNSAIGSFVNTINGAMNCASTQQGAQNLVASGFSSCGEAAAAKKFFMGSLLRDSLMQAHIGLIGGTSPGSGGVNDLIGALRGSFVGDVVGYQSASKNGLPVVKYVPPVMPEAQTPNGANTITKTFDVLMFGGNINYMTIGDIQPAQTYTIGGLEGLSQSCFPGFMYYYQNYLNDIVSKFISDNAALTKPYSACPNPPAVASLTEQQMANFITSSKLPVILIAKLAYVNQDPNLINTAAQAMALSYMHNTFSTLLHGTETSIAANKNLNEKNNLKFIKLFLKRVNTMIRMDNDYYDSALQSINDQQDTLKYYQTINKEWVSTLSQYGLSGAYTFKSF